MQPVISKLRLPNIHIAPEYLHVVPFQLAKINVGADRAQSLNLSLGALVLPDVNF